MENSPYSFPQRLLPYLKAVRRFYSDYSKKKPSSGGRNDIARYSTIESYVKDALPDFNENDFSQTIIEMQSMGFLQTNEHKKPTRNRHYKLHKIPSAMLN